MIEQGSVDACRWVDLPRLADPRGMLSFVETGRHIDFPIARVYYLYDVPPGEARGAHAHRALRQLFIPLGGAFDVEVDDGRRRKRFRLDSPHRALYVCPMIWRDLGNFTPGASCVVLASLPFDEGDYIRDYATFVAEVEGK